MNKLRLGTRLFLSHLLVMLVGLGTFALIAKYSSPRFFVLHLEQLESRGFFTVRSARTYLVEGFQQAWNRSTLWSVVVGVTAAGGLSYWISRRIMQPLHQMEVVTQKLAKGNLQERMPKSEIPELNQLRLSFNRMASSLEGVEQKRRELISDMTHELRTPLTVMRGYLEELADGTIDASPEIYQRLVRETRRLERLANDLQELSKAEAGYLPIHLQKVDLYPLLVSLVERFRDQLLEDGPVIQLDCANDLPLVCADRDRAEQILVNLLGNAIRYTPHGSITLRAQSKSRFLWVAVEDTGIGIAAEDLPFVFERFWRSERSRDRYSGGTGIGLAITRRLVELQGGQIQVESERDRGSIFAFSLPLA
ncbi:HAMP domain-containing histidine kinase [Lusitaniella coriacea LEGE 07157]|uniref:histidine kinase n=1 Tax=Lusitaniella coriacea LEGE 07157 TaxID=945747 RepID=A0A8J7B3I6_9CYAN|nr:HAMP domain-containing sensor histidine kinase [Lusitaniella coriacea]MBE9115082.1 HAMP domain-containing histidine kinase [Lusitaniella coriacea LEGE 07157]